MLIIHIGVTTFPAIPSVSGGAIQRVIWELARAQRDAGDDVAIVSIGAASAAAVVDGIAIVYIKCRLPWPARHLEFLTGAALAIRRLSRGRRDAVVHFHSQPEGVLFRAVFQRPVVLSYDFYGFRRGRQGAVGALIRHCLLQFDLLLPCSEYCRRESIEHWGLPDRRVRVLPNGVNTEQFRPLGGGRAAELADIPAGTCVVLYVGRICAQKGSDVLIAAAEALAGRRVPACVVAAGPVERFDAIGDADDWTGRLRRGGIRYLGQVPEARLAEIYRSADVFVMPTVALEMFGMAALEALACGVPVIATDHGGLPEVVTTSCGLLVPPGDAAALAGAIERLVRDPGERARLAGGAALRAGALSWPAIARRARACYAVAMGDPAGAASG